MKRLLLSVILSWVLFVPVRAQQLELSGKRALDSLLRAIEAADQGVREEVMRLSREKTLPQDSLLAASIRMNEVDAMNQRIVFPMLDLDGWPDGLSEEANRGIWYVIQHASQEDIKRYLPMIKDAAAKGRIGMADYALTMDRVLMHDKLPQRFGSQTFFIGSADGEQNTLWLWPVEDSERIDSLRATVGLPSIAEYLEDVEEAIGQPVVWDRSKTAEEMARMRGW